MLAVDGKKTKVSEVVGVEGQMFCPAVTCCVVPRALSITRNELHRGSNYQSHAPPRLRRLLNALVVPSPYFTPQYGE